MSAELHVVKGMSEKRAFDLNRGTMLIGRSPGSDIQIKDPSISRRHAEIIKRGEKFFVKDLNSQNGTWILGNKIRPGYDLEVADGCPITIGKVVLRLEKGMGYKRLISLGSVNMSMESEDVLGSIFAAIHEAIRPHGGVIKVSSEKGVDAKFNIYMNMNKYRENGEGRESSFSPGVSVYGGIETVLVVDDDEAIIQLYRQVLERLGYRVLSSESGRQAIELLKETCESGCDPDLVILDMVMPGMGGEAVFGEIKKIKPDMKVLIASGYSLKGELARVLSQGCSGYIQKPFTIKALSEKIAEIETGDTPALAHIR